MLAGKTIAIPESRQLDVLATLIEKRGGTVMRVPLVGIKDAPDPEPVLAWMRDFIAAPSDIFIILTGEGIRRLVKLARAHGLEDDFVTALGACSKLYRGPKPDRALSEVGLKGDIQSQEPTTDGIISTLESMDIEAKRIAVQLYGEEANEKLMEYLQGRKALVSVVAPYVYADQSEEKMVLKLIDDLYAGHVDMIAFTSQPQFRRLQQVARRYGLEDRLAGGLNSTPLAAVGPVVRDQLEAAGYMVEVMPERAYFMKPLVTAMVKYFDGSGG